MKRTASLWLLVCVFVVACGDKKVDELPGGDTGPSDTDDTETVDTDECLPVEEIPYDGVDQDCDGLDLTDVDGDGHDAEAVGGDDCDDEDGSISPSAIETPYDDIDQDCDGADLRDVDGDGHEGEAVDGDDCDDEDPATYPGAEDVKGDDKDNDCDGFADEYLACHDGTGDAMTIQGAVDLAPAGGAVEICAGTYEEYVQVGRDLTAYSTGHPEDVVLSGAKGEGGFLISGSATRFELQSATLLADGGVGRFSTGEEGVAGLHLERVDFCGDWSDGGYELGLDAAGDIALRHVRICGPESDATPTTNTNHRLHVSAGSLLIEGSYLRGDLSDAIGFAVGLYVTGQESDQSVTIQNNIVERGYFAFGAYSQLETNHRIQFTVRNNTMVGMETLNFLFMQTEDVPAYQTSFYDNILAHIDAGGVWEVEWYADGDPGDLIPSPAGPNLIFDVGQPLVDLSWADGEYADFGVEITASAIDAEPAFDEHGPYGSYSLSADSPAVNAGSNPLDPHGSTNDLGAFGGPNLNIWEDYPWPLP